MLTFNGVKASSSSNFAVLRNLTGIYAHWTYLGQDDSAVACAGAGFDFSAYATLGDLTFTDPSGITYYVHPCGPVRAAACANSSAEGAQACAISTTGAATVISRYQPSEAVYRPLSSPVTGVQVAFQNGAYCNAISAESIAAFNYICDPSATAAPVLQNVTVYSSCLYSFTLRSAIACATSNVSPLNLTSTLPNCTVAVGSNYTSTWCPSNSTGVAPIKQTNPVVLPLSSTSTAIKLTAIPIGFTFYMYETPFQTVTVGTHGVLSFGSAPTTTALGSFPSSRAMAWTITRSSRLSAFLY